jgi:hypothetical protein
VNLRRQYDVVAGLGNLVQQALMARYVSRRGLRRDARQHAIGILAAGIAHAIDRIEGCRPGEEDGRSAWSPPWRSSVPDRAGCRSAVPRALMRDGFQPSIRAPMRPHLVDAQGPGGPFAYAVRVVDPLGRRREDRAG